ncbi:MAG: flagellar basal body L-ring protein FlgH [Desulfatiglandales bacterium]
MAPPPKPQIQPITREPGSLFSDGARFSSMFVDKKGRSVGDVITVKIVESSSASNSTDTQTGRKSDLQAGVSQFLGLQNYPFHHYFNPFGPVGGNFQNSFQGGGKTERKNTVLGTITATVIEVLPNENLRIMGSREVIVNNEKQLLTISGVVREKDIADDNTVLSTYLAEAKIYYTGSGDLAETQRQGWLSRILGIIWPF